MILLIGLAVGVDYSLFYFRRAREERAGGVSSHDAVVRASATSGKAILTSGMTVVVAMLAMLITGLGTFIGMAEGTAIVVAVAIATSLLCFFIFEDYLSVLLPRGMWGGL